MGEILKVGVVNSTSFPPSLPPILPQITVILAILSSVFVSKKCKRIQNTDHYCIYPLDIVLCVIIILLLVPQIIVVSHKCVTYNGESGPGA